MACRHSFNSVNNCSQLELRVKLFLEITLDAVSFGSVKRETSCAEWDLQKKEFWAVEWAIYAQLVPSWKNSTRSKTRKCCQILHVKRFLFSPLNLNWTSRHFGTYFWTFTGRSFDEFRGKSILDPCTKNYKRRWTTVWKNWYKLNQL